MNKNSPADNAPKLLGDNEMMAKARDAQLLRSKHIWGLLVAVVKESRRQMREPANIDIDQMSQVLDRCVRAHSTLSASDFNTLHCGVKPLGGADRSRTSIGTQQNVFVLPEKADAQDWPERAKVEIEEAKRIRDAIVSEDPPTD